MVKHPWSSGQVEILKRFKFWHNAITFLGICSVLDKKEADLQQALKDLEEEHLQRHRLEWEVHMLGEKCQQYEEHVSHQQSRYNFL